MITTITKQFLRNRNQERSTWNARREGVKMLPGRNQTTNWCRGDKNTTLTPCLCCRRFNSTQLERKKTHVFCTHEQYYFSPLATTLRSFPFSSTCLIFSSPFSYSPITNNNFPLFVLSTTSFTKIFTSKIVLLFCVQFAYPVSLLKIKILLKKIRNGSVDCSNKM